MDPIREPRSTEQATALLERFAELDSQIAAIEANRTASISDVNARCDRAANELTAQREAIRAKIEPWWRKRGHKLANAGRKSVELGGCMLGSRAGKASLAIAGDEKDVIEVLRALKWAKPFLRIKTTLDRIVLLKAVNGPHKAALAEVGITERPGDEQFFLERTKQGGSTTGAA